MSAPDRLTEIETPTALHRAVNTLATRLRFSHHADDGCLDHLDEA